MTRHFLSEALTRTGASDDGKKISRFREITKERVDEFYSKGYKRRYFFPHRIYYLPKCGPDGFKLANLMCGGFELNQLWEVVIYADDPLPEHFPRELFFDDDLIWHQQQFGKTGQVATANLVVKDRALYSMVHISDLVQRISRKREFKTQIENRFKGWNHLLLNSVLNFAREQGLNPVYTPTSGLALKNTDAARNVVPELFERVYDRNVHELFDVSKAGVWWAIDLGLNQNRIVEPERGQEILPDEKAICLCHDIERGFGHTSMDPSLASFAHQTSDKQLDKILAVEREVGVKATYNVLGKILLEVRAKIEADAHCLGFHSYDHQVDSAKPLKNRLSQVLARIGRMRVNDANRGQLDRCRDIDYRIKGYRPPQSRITNELSDSNLAFHNFEWLASSSYSLKISLPELRNRIVRIPISFDDFDMYHRKMKYGDWERMALENIRQDSFLAFSLHDCYAHFWLPHYRQFLERVKGLGTLKTLNDVASEVILSNAI